VSGGLDQNEPLLESVPSNASQEFRQRAGERIREVLDQADRAFLTCPPIHKACIEKTLSLCENNPDLNHLMPGLQSDLEWVNAKMAWVASPEYGQAREELSDLIDGTSEDVGRYQLALEGITILQHNVERMLLGSEKGQEDLARLGIKLSQSV